MTDLRFNIAHDGKVFPQITAEEAEGLGIPVDVIAAAATKAKWQAVRAKRDRLLTASDWTQMSDCPLTDAKKADWATYRQTLRDIPQDADTPDAVTWPDAPAA